eukprot:4602678-Prymnesium_polylepis.1
MAPRVRMSSWTESTAALRNVTSLGTDQTLPLLTAVSSSSAPLRSRNRLPEEAHSTPTHRMRSAGNSCRADLTKPQTPAEVDDVTERLSRCSPARAAAALDCTIWRTASSAHTSACREKSPTAMLLIPELRTAVVRITARHGDPVLPSSATGAEQRPSSEHCALAHWTWY